MSTAQWANAGEGGDGFASAAVGPFRLRASTNVYAVSAGGWGASGMAASVGHAKRKALAVLRNHLERWPGETIEGQRVAELLAALAALERDTV